MNTLTVSWFSAGVSSAVATWLVRDQVDKIIYQHIDDQHCDTMRFVKDCERWFGKPIEIIQSPYKSVNNACRAMAYINTPAGAACTRLLKRRVRKEWEIQNEWFNRFCYVWGMDVIESKPNLKRKDKLSRCDALREAMPNQDHLFPLVDKQITKEEAHGILHKAGIKRPAMYDLGYRNNNCIGCVKGAKGYWNKIRIDFPEVFRARAEMERLIEATCMNKERERPDQPASETNTAKLYLDELDPQSGRDQEPVVEECGAMCEIISKETL